MFESFLGVNPWTALLTLLNTLLICFAAKKFLFAPVTRIISDRQQEIDGLYADAGRAKRDAEAMRTEYQTRLADAQAASDRILAEAVSRSQTRAEEILRQANAEAANLLDKASADIAQEKKKALNEAKNEITDIALAIAANVLGREVTAGDQARLVDCFLDEWEEQP